MAAPEPDAARGQKRTAAEISGPSDAVFFAYVDAHKDDYISRLAEFVAIPGVSMEPARRSEVCRAVNWAKAWMEKLGGAVTLEDIGEEVIPGGPNIPLPPVLLAQFGDDPKKQTLLVYGHLDVQPANLSDGWDSDPWTLTERNGALYARGATDDKGPVCAWMWVVEAHQKLGWELPVNLKFILEGMEECASKGLPALVKRLGAPGAFLDPRTVDFICISDNYWTGKVKPCVCHGLRGNVYFHLEVQCSSKDLHSGVFGGAVHEGMTDCIKIMSSLVDTSGKILIPGIGDDIAPLSEKEARSYEQVDFDVEEFKKDAGVDVVSQKLMHDTKEGILMHRWRYPALSLHGIQGAFDGVGSKTVIPASVIGKFSIRIVPNMHPEKVEALVRKHVEAEWAKLKSPNRMKLMVDKASMPWFRDPEDPNYRAATAATRRVHGVDPAFTREGGSIPITELLEQVADAVCVLLPIGASDDGAHSQNEKFDIKNYLNGIKLLSCYIHELAALPPVPDAAAQAAHAAAEASRLASNRWRKRCKVNLVRYGCECLACQD